MALSQSAEVPGLAPRATHRSRLRHGRHGPRAGGAPAAFEIIPLVLEAPTANAASGSPTCAALAPTGSPRSCAPRAPAGCDGRDGLAARRYHVGGRRWARLVHRRLERSAPIRRVVAAVGGLHGGMRARCIHCNDVAGNKYGGVRHRRFQSSKTPDDAGSNLTLDQALQRTKHRLQTKKGRFISASGCCRQSGFEQSAATFNGILNPGKSQAMPGQRMV